MTLRVAINGFGRVGRAVTRAWLGGHDVSLVAINDIADPNILAHLFRFDSVHGRWPGAARHAGGAFVIDGRRVLALREADPARLPWRALGVDVVIEASGQTRSRTEAEGHLRAGARRVVVTAPLHDADAMLVYGVNHDSFNPEQHRIVSNASCTANCVIPILVALDDAFGWSSGYMTTIHPSTSDQRIVDAPHGDVRRARAAGAGIIPTTTSAIDCVRSVLPRIGARFDGMAYRVPTLTAAVVDLIVRVRRSTTKRAVNDAFRHAAARLPKGVLAVSDEPLVGADYVGDEHSATVDAPSTTVSGGTQVHITAWYDNETGYAHRVLDVVEAIAGRHAVTPGQPGHREPVSA